MMNGRTPLYLTLVAGAVLAGAVVVFQPYSAECPGQGYTEPAQRYLGAAIRQDSVALVRLSASPGAVAWALAAARAHRDSLAAWSHGVQAWVGTRHADTTEVFVFNASSEVCRHTPIVLQFVGSGQSVRVVRASSPCLGDR